MTKSDVFSGVYRIRFGTGNVQIGTGIQKETGKYVVAFKYCEKAFGPVPNDTSKTMEAQGYEYFLEFSTVKSVDTLIGALQSVRDEMKEKENV